jgi:hypothetical protein
LLGAVLIPVSEYWAMMRVGLYIVIGVVKNHSGGLNTYNNELTQP